jgi:hypothetical protein
MAAQSMGETASRGGAMINAQAIDFLTYIYEGAHGLAVGDVRAMREFRLTLTNLADRAVLIPLVSLLIAILGLLLWIKECSVRNGLVWLDQEVKRDSGNLLIHAEAFVVALILVGAALIALAS